MGTVDRRQVLVSQRLTRSGTARRWSETIATGGACAYVIGFVLPIGGDVALLILAATSSLAVLFSERSTRWRSPMFVAVVGFAISAAMSTYLADEWRRGLPLCFSLLPGLLLFFLITGFCDGPRSLAAIYLAFGFAGLMLAVGLLIHAWHTPSADPAMLVSALGSPVLLVPNDVILLVLVVPLAVAGLYQLPRWMAAPPIIAIALSALASVTLLQSRGATIVIAGCFGGLAVLVRWRQALLAGLAAVVIVLGIDGARGFPLIAKFSGFGETRLALWISAVAMAREAPWFGHGPGGFGLLHESYVSKLELATWLRVDDRTVPWAHNLYLETLADQGLVGLCFLALLFGTGIMLARRAFRNGSGEVRALAAGALASLAGLGIAALFELSFARQWVAVLTFTLLGGVVRLASTIPTTPTEDHR